MPRVSEVAVASVAHTSLRHRRLIRPTTVRLPSIRPRTRACAARVKARIRRAPVQPCMRSMTVIDRREQSAVEMERGSGISRLLITDYLDLLAFPGILKKFR